MRLKQRSTVVLPQPDGPMKAVISWRRTGAFDVAHGPEVAVVDVEVLDVEHDLGVALGRLRRRGRAAHRVGLVGVDRSGGIGCTSVGPRRVRQTRWTGVSITVGDGSGRVTTSDRADTMRPR